MNARKIHEHIVSTLGDLVLGTSPLDSKPLELDLQPPLPRRTRIYCYTLTCPPGGRSLREYKIQIKLKDHAVHKRCDFDHSGGRMPILLGYEPEFDVFVLWDAGLYSSIPYNRNVQVHEDTVCRAYAGQLAEQSRTLQKAALETVLAARSDRLQVALVKRLSLTLARVANT